jgi:putative oxidoreductase
MKHASTIAAALLGLLFVVFGLNFWLKFIPMPPDASPDSAPHKLFMAAFFPTGYLAFVKAIEVIGGLLLALPKTRNLGLLLLGPVIVNIFAYHFFLTNRGDMLSPPMLIIAALSLFILVAERKTWASLIK